MIINITCPNCNFSKQVPSENIPAGIKNAKCPRCSKTFEIQGISEPEPPSGSPLPKEPIQEVTPQSLPEKITEIDAEPVDMPEPPAPDEVGYFTGLWRVFSGVIFSPAEFFRGVRDTAVKDALIFGILTGSIGVMFRIFWMFLFESQELKYITNLFPDVNFNEIYLGLIIWAPFIVLMSALLMAAVIHVTLFVFGGASRGFEGTFKVILYSNAASIFNLFYYNNMGEIIAFVLSVVIIVVGLKEIHETKRWKALLALLLPVFFLFILKALTSFLAVKIL
jgi:predicted Zn finger-like uncharacterized protein